MFEKNLEVGLLLDFYGDILPERRREMIELYYNDDLSLAEVAEQLGVTRQAVRETVKKTETELYFYEEKLGLLRRFTEKNGRTTGTDALCEAEKDCVSPALREAIDRLCDAVGAG